LDHYGITSGAVPRLSVTHNDATGNQARTIRDADKGRNSILWKSHHQRIQGKVSRHERPVFPHLLFLGRDKTHVEWVKAYTAIFDDMTQYVMEHHTTGLVWNAKARKIHASPSRACVDGPCYRAYPSPSTRPQHRPPPSVVLLLLPRRRLHLLARCHRPLFPQHPPLPLVVVLRQFSPSLTVVQK
jgi:hypothetical protein